MTAQIISGLCVVVVIWSLIDLAIEYTRKQQYVQLGITAAAFIIFTWILTNIPVAEKLRWLNTATAERLEQLSASAASSLRHSSMLLSVSEETMLIVLGTAVLVTATISVVLGIFIIKLRLKTKPSHLDIWK